jgi:hypothetical protein
MSKNNPVTTKGGKKIAILQSNYIPWKGYFDIIRRVDEFILYDNVQFTRRDWRNRNRIKSPQGLLWLTIPVVSKSRYTQLICETEIADPHWAEAHWNTIKHNYGKAPAFAAMEPKLEDLMQQAGRERMLSEANYILLRGFCDLLGIATPLTWAMNYAVTGQKTDRLLALCRAAGADAYLSGPAAKDYIDDAKFSAAGVRLEYMDYTGYPVYPQLYGAFEHGVSIIDAFMMLGDKTKTAIMPDTDRKGL